MPSNIPSPLIPQGTFLDKQPARSHIRIAVFTILAVHVVLLGALLLQGCKRTAEPSNVNAGGTPTNSFSGWQEQTPPPPSLDFLTSNIPASTSYGSDLPPPPPPPGISPGGSLAGNATGSQPIPSGSTEGAIAPFPGVREVVPPPPPDTQPYSTPSAPAAGGTDYVVIRGDSFSTIADRFGVTVKAIQNANPAIDPRRIQIGQKIFVPAAAPKPVQPAATALAAGGKVHQVKSGDTLWEIASKNGTTVKELRSANNLTTDRIVVGQELVIP